MKTSLKLTLLIITIALTSCRENNIVLNFDEFPKTLKLSGKSLGIKELMRGGFPNYYDTLIILRAVNESGKLIYIYNRKDYDLISQSINVGRGPNEISLPGFITLDKDNRTLLCQDILKKDLWKFNIDSILTNPDYFPKDKSMLPNILSPFQIDPVNDSIISIIDNKPSNLISFCDLKGKITDSIPNYLNIYNPQDLSRELLMLTAYYCYEKHPSESRYAIIYHTSDIIAIVDSNGNLIRKMVGPSDTYQIPKYGDNQIMTNTYTDSDDRFIYSSYLNKPRWNIENPQEIFYPNEINVYDWNGNPRAKLVLDTSIASFTVDPENEELLVFSATNNDLILYSLRLSDI